MTDKRKNYKIPMERVFGEKLLRTRNDAIKLKCLCSVNIKNRGEAIKTNKILFL